MDIKLEKTYTVLQKAIGPMANFTYLIGDNKTRQAGIVDPCWDVQSIVTLAEKNNYNITDILLTHSHFDHTNMLDALYNKTQASVHIHQDEIKYLESHGVTLHQLTDG